MELTGLPDPITRILQRADFAAHAAGTRIRVADTLGAAFHVNQTAGICIPPGCGLDAAQGSITLRHALELALLLRLWPDNPVLAGLAAARTAALFAVLERPPQMSGADARPPAPCAAMAAATPPHDPADIWRTLAPYQSPAPADLPPGTLETLRRIWPVLGPAEWLMQTGGDARLSVDPVTGLNGYGCSHRPRPWAVTFASSTASSSSERGYQGAELLRRQMLQDALGSADPVAGALAAVRADIAAQYRLPAGCTVALAPSGTDGELFATAIAQLHPAGRPLTVVLVAPEETGSGVPLAAAGRHFAADTARAVRVPQGTVIGGFRDDTQVAAVPLRAADGAVRPAADIAADCARIAAAAVQDGRHVLLHRVDVSKTGLLAPGEAVLQAIQHRYPGQVDVAVDACQARLSPGRVGAYLAHGWMVLLTGSKFLTGPPFSGGLLLPPALRARLLATRLPAGLHDYSARAEWPADLPAAADLPPGGNAGLALRWAAALAELRAFNAVPDAAKHGAITGFITRVSAAIEASADFKLIDVPSLDRGGAPAWDGLRTVLSFAIRDPDSPGWLNPDAARRVYNWLNADLSRALPGDLGARQMRLAHRRFHSGQPAKLIFGGAPAGVLRLSAGARLVAGEPSHAALSPQHRLDREVADALALLDKIVLILRHWTLLQHAAPVATYN